MSANYPHYAGRVASVALVVSLLGRGDVVIEGRTVINHVTTTVTVGIL